jgi:SAM-dependent methyltransferase
MSSLFNLLFTPKKISETSKCRESLSKFCQGDGIDIGYGGDPIVPHAICMDQVQPYAKYLDNVQHLHGDAHHLRWFKNETLDFVYSSHVLEDFKDTQRVLDEWLRVLKVGGVLVLFLPDEQTYRAYCRSQGKPPNAHHIHENFSLDFVKSALAHRQDLEIIHSQFPVAIYSFELVIKKIKSSLPAGTYYVDDFPQRDALLQEIYAQLKQGSAWREAIRTPRAAKHGERVAEYAFMASYLLEHQPKKILDVGCVLNNPIIDPLIHPESELSFLNPSLEKLVRSQAHYHQNHLSDHTLSSDFDLVSCLSTLEHIGFDNTRYHVDEKDQNWDWPRCVQEFTANIERLLQLVNPSGHAIISCPYGKAEFVLHPPLIGVRTAQVINSQHVEALRQSKLVSRLQMTFLRLSQNGWEEAEYDSEFKSYGEIGPGASGLILITSQTR